MTSPTVSQTAAALTTERRDPVKVRRSEDLLWPEARLLGEAIRASEVES